MSTTFEPQDHIEEKQMITNGAHMSDHQLRTVTISNGGRDSKSAGQSQDKSAEFWQKPIVEPRPTDEIDGDFSYANDLQALAAWMIHDFPELRILRPLSISYFWKRKGGKSQGRETLGKCTRTSGLIRHLSGSDFVVWLAADTCQGFTADQIEAALYHELLHIDLDDETMEPKLVGHELEMFRGEVTRYGLWRLDIQAAAETFEQLALEVA